MNWEHKPADYKNREHRSADYKSIIIAKYSWTL